MHEFLFVARSCSVPQASLKLVVDLPASDSQVLGWEYRHHARLIIFVFLNEK